MLRSKSQTLVLLIYLLVRKLYIQSGSESCLVEESQGRAEVVSIVPIKCSALAIDSNHVVRRLARNTVRMNTAGILDREHVVLTALGLETDLRVIFLDEDLV